VRLLPILTAQSSKYTAGAITVVEVIITDGATIGDITIIIGEINLGVGGLFHLGQRLKLSEPFFTEDECMNRTALLGRTGLLHETNPKTECNVVCEHLPSDNNQ
jgi:hypothetical protein